MVGVLQVRFAVVCTNTGLILAAEVENLERMQKHFANTVQIFLEDNYRSTGAILAASIAIVAEGEPIVDHADLRRLF